LVLDSGEAAAEPATAALAARNAEQTDASRTIRVLMPTMIGDYG